MLTVFNRKELVSVFDLEKTSENPGGAGGCLYRIHGLKRSAVSVLHLRPTATAALWERPGGKPESEYGIHDLCCKTGL